MAKSPKNVTFYYVAVGPGADPEHLRAYTTTCTSHMDEFHITDFVTADSPKEFFLNDASVKFLCRHFVALKCKTHIDVCYLR